MPEVTINDQNWQEFVEPIVDGERKSRGLRPRNYQSHPVGYLPQAKPFDLPLIPQSEWASRLADIVAAKAQLSDVRNTGNNGQPIPSRDQDQKGYCHTADTEVLTERGWVAWSEYNYSDLLATVNTISGAMEFQAPVERHVYEYDGEMVHSTNRRLDFGVTPDHRMMVRKWDERARTLSGQYTFQRAGEIGWYTGFMNAPRVWLGTELVEVEIPGDRRYDGDDLIALLSLIVSDGFAASYEHSGNLVSFASFRPECRDRVAALAARVGFREQPSRPGVWNRWGAGALAQWIFANCYTDGGFKAQYKKVPDLVKVASRRQIEHFLTWNGDQNHKRESHGEHYYSASKRMIDDLQELCLRVGRRGTITHRDPRTGTMPQGTISTSRECWELDVSKTDRLCIERKKHIETDRYKGLVYCAAVPNGTLVTRRNGSVLISGNCWAHSTVSASLIVRALNNQPYADLSAFAIACIIKGYRDEGGWGAESLEWAAVNGCPTSQFWPQQSMSRSNDTPAMRENARLHKVTEWMDLDPQQMQVQLVTCLLSGIPVVSDFNWWGHSVCSIDLVSVSPFRTRIWNSWGDSWSENGTGILEGQKAIPNGAIAPRVIDASQT